MPLVIDPFGYLHEGSKLQHCTLLIVTSLTKDIELSYTVHISAHSQETILALDIVKATDKEDGIAGAFCQGSMLAKICMPHTIAA